MTSEINSEMEWDEMDWNTIISMVMSGHVARRMGTLMIPALQ